jgi:hypothetical protein
VKCRKDSLTAAFVTRLLPMAADAFIQYGIALTSLAAIS